MSLLSVLAVLACTPPAVVGIDPVDTSDSDPWPPPDTALWETAESGDTDTETDTDTDTDTDTEDTGNVEHVGGTGETPYTHGDTEWFFGDTAIRNFEITLSDESWRQLTRDPYNYVEASFTSVDDGITLTGVGVHLKGGSTFRDIRNKASFKLKFDYLVEDQELHDERRLTLNSMVYDPSMIAEFMTYKIWRLGGDPASRVGYANVTVNGEPYGLYSIIETMDEHIAKVWFKSDEGTMYEPNVNYYPCDFDKAHCFDVEESSGDEEADRAQIEALCDTVMHAEGDWVTAVSGTFDWDKTLDNLALEMVLAHWDGYAENINNYHLYFEPEEQLWYWFPWSADLAFGWYPWGAGQCGNYAANPREYSNGQFAKKCNRDATCKAQLADHLLEIADRMEAMDFDGQIDTLYALIYDAAMADPKKEYRDDQLEPQVECIREWIRARPAYIRDWVGG